MMKSLKKFGGAILLYLVIFFGIVAITSRVNYIGQENSSVNDGVVAIQR